MLKIILIVAAIASTVIALAALRMSSMCAREEERRWRDEGKHP